MHLIAEGLEAHVEQYSTQEDEVLQALNRETHQKIMLPQMLSGHVQGNLLYMMSRMMQAERILEVGTYTGYSAICMARGMKENGHLHTIDINEELEDMVAKYVDMAGLSGQVTQHVGNAMDIIPNIDEQFDMVFIDADKINYANYYDLVFDKVKIGGYIIADNVLWNGEVIEENPRKDARALLEYTQKINADARVWNLLLAVRDGLLVAQKISH